MDTTHALEVDTDDVTTVGGAAAEITQVESMNSAIPESPNTEESTTPETVIESAPSESFETSDIESPPETGVAGDNVPEASTLAQSLPDQTGVVFCRQLTKRYRNAPRAALDDVSLLIERGEFVFLVGPSGSGKTTLLRLFLREEKASMGIVSVGGLNVSQLPNRQVPLLRQKLGVVFQDFRLLAKKTVFENVAFALEVIGKPSSHIDLAVPQVLELVGLADLGTRFPHELSGGEQQRVAIARAIVNRPEVLLADEPTGNLDPATSAGIVELLSRINATGTTVIMATHDSQIVDDLEKRVVEMRDGRIVRDQKRGEYLRSHGTKRG